jgi:hypothetical protein
MGNLSDLVHESTGFRFCDGDGFRLANLSPTRKVPFVRKTSALFWFYGVNAANIAI